MATAMKLAAGSAEPHYRVLLVDDERDVRRMLQRSMARMGFDTTEASDGQAALELLRREEFDLVVSDVQMPGMTGIELLSALDREGLDVPVVLMSGSLEVPNVGAARDLGAFDFFRKPFPLEELRKAARRAAVSRRASGRHSLRPVAVDSEA